MVYLPALKNGFVWDDVYFITDLPYLRDPALWWQHVREPLFVSQNYFRPLPLLTFVLEAQYSPLNAFVFHLTNLLLHAVNVTLVVLLARRLVAANGGNDTWRPLLAGLLFGLHPALIETVSWVSDRFDLMMATFLLLALLCDTDVQHRLLKPVVPGLLFLLALLCKETSIVFFALLPLWQLSRMSPERTTWRNDIRQLVRESWPTWAALVVAAILYFALRYQSLGVLYRSDTQIASGNLLQHILLCSKTLGWYFVLLCWPFGQIGPVHPGVTPIALDDASAWLGMAAVIAVLCGLTQLLRRAPRTGMLTGMALVALAPVANLMPLTIGDNIVHDRYLLLPLAFMSLALTTVPALHVRRAAILGAGLWAALSLTTIVLTVPRWESNLSLWGWAHALEPGSNIARGNYVAALVNSGHYPEAMVVAQELLRTSPDNPIALYNMGLSLMRLGRNEEARGYVERSLQRLDKADTKGNMDVTEAWNLLGYLSMQAGDWSSAEKSLNEATRLTPYLTRPHFNLAMLHYERGDAAAGDKELAFALRYDSPEMATIHRAQAAKKKAELLARGQAMP